MLVGTNKTGNVSMVKWACRITMATRRNSSRVKSNSIKRGLQSIPTAQELSELERIRQNEVTLKATIRTVSQYQNVIILFS